jgi:hypothetical protein
LEEKKKFDPLAKDWLVGNIGKEEVKEAEETTEDKVNKDTVEFKNILEDDETEETKDKVKEGKEDTVGFKNILEDVEEK